MGGRNSKIHAIVDADRRPGVLTRAPGNPADCIMAQECVSLIPASRNFWPTPPATLRASRAFDALCSGGHDTDAFRASLGKEGIKPVIPDKSNRKKRIRHAKKDYKKRNVNERCIGKLKNFRRLAARYDKLAQKFFSALCFVATLACLV
jgi:transposase